MARRNEMGRNGPERRGKPKGRFRGSSRPIRAATRAPAREDPELAFGADSDILASGAEEGGAPTLVRLNKYMADHGIASRRKCDELIQAGKVTIDGEPAIELGTRIDPELRRVEIDGVLLKPLGAKKRYYLLNKPAGVVCTNEERETRPRAVDLITDRKKGRIYTVGRLDEESKGLILLTNDGEFANRVMHPRYGVEKTYYVKVLGKIDDVAVQKVRDGVQLAEGRTSGARILVERRTREYTTLTLSLNEGMNREIRRVFARVGYKVVDLRRTRIGPLSERGIKIGRWRELTPGEVRDLVAGRNKSSEAVGISGHGARAGRRPPIRKSGHRGPRAFDPRTARHLVRPGRPGRPMFGARTPLKKPVGRRQRGVSR